MLRKSIELSGCWTSLYLTIFYYSIMISSLLDIESYYHNELNLVNAMSKIYIQVGRVKGCCL